MPSPIFLNSHKNVTFFLKFTDVHIFKVLSSKQLDNNHFIAALLAIISWMQGLFFLLFCFCKIRQLQIRVKEWVTIKVEIRLLWAIYLQSQHESLIKRNVLLRHQWSGVCADCVTWLMSLLAFTGICLLFNSNCTAIQIYWKVKRRSRGTTGNNFMAGLFWGC